MLDFAEVYLATHLLSTESGSNTEFQLILTLRNQGTLSKSAHKYFYNQFGSIFYEGKLYFLFDFDLPRRDLYLQFPKKIAEY